MYSGQTVFFIVTGLGDLEDHGAQLAGREGGCGWSDHWRNGLDGEDGFAEATANLGEHLLKRWSLCRQAELR